MSKSQPVSQDPEFGRPLVVMSLTTNQIMAWIGIGAVLLVIGVGALVGLGSSIRPGAAIGAIVAILGGLVLLGAGLMNLGMGAKRTVFYESGVQVTRRGTGERLAYRDANVAYYTAKSDAGVERVLEVHPRKVEGPIRASTKKKPGQPGRLEDPSVQDLEALRDIVVEAVAERMMGEITAGKTVRWSGGAALAPLGVVLNGKTIPWDAIEEQANQKTGRYDLLVRGEQKPVATLKMIELNFLPGWRVVTSMRESARSATA